MTEQQRQHVSELADGELDASLTHATLSAIGASPELTTTWGRYHLIGTALRHEPTRTDYHQLAQRVHLALEGEPARLAHRRTRHRRADAGPFAGAALAAAIALLAVFAVPQLFEPARPTSPQLADGGAGRSLPDPATGFSATPTDDFLITETGQRWRLDHQGLEDKLDRFLVNHQASAPFHGSRGFLPYTRVVGYEPGR